VDGTIGGGGHADHLLRSHPEIKLLVGIDRDEEAIWRARKRLAHCAEKCRFVHGNFAHMDTIVKDHGITSVDGIYLDLGTSRHQLKAGDRGFSFSEDGDLDMRMDRTQRTTAADLVNSLSEKDLVRVLRDYGEERWAPVIAKKIVRRRRSASMSTTGELAALVSSSIPRKHHPRTIHAATRTFQALRIAVNDELTHVREGVKKGVSLLSPGGRIAIISFHSLEDRIVKNALREYSRNCLCPPQFPVCRCGHRATVTVLTRKPIMPTEKEIERNPLSRSARLRGAEKLPN
jgi:16S rRNA (cytosine1402-N4)-methyltransferase